MKNFRINRNDFTLEIGKHGWFIDPRNNKYNHLIITSNGVYLDGKIIAKGKLKIKE